MKSEKYKMDDIAIGDEVLFNDNIKVEHNIFWKVINKISNSRLLVEIREMGYAEKFHIETSDIIALQRGGMQIENIN